MVYEPYIRPYGRAIPQDQFGAVLSRDTQLRSCENDHGAAAGAAKCAAKSGLSEPEICAPLPTASGARPPEPPTWLRYPQDRWGCCLGMLRGARQQRGRLRTSHLAPVPIGANVD